MKNTFRLLTFMFIGTSFYASEGQIGYGNVIARRNELQSDSPRVQQRKQKKSVEVQIDEFERLLYDVKEWVNFLQQENKDQFLPGGVRVFTTECGMSEGGAPDTFEIFIIKGKNGSSLTFLEDIKKRQFLFTVNNPDDFPFTPLGALVAYYVRIKKFPIQEIVSF